MIRTLNPVASVLALPWYLALAKSAITVLTSTGGSEGAWPSLACIFVAAAPVVLLAALTCFLMEAMSQGLVRACTGGVHAHALVGSVLLVEHAALVAPRLATALPQFMGAQAYIAAAALVMLEDAPVVTLLQALAVLAVHSMACFQQLQCAGNITSVFSNGSGAWFGQAEPSASQSSWSNRDDTMIQCMLSAAALLAAGPVSQALHGLWAWPPASSREATPAYSHHASGLSTPGLEGHVGLSPRVSKTSTALEEHVLRAISGTLSEGGKGSSEGGKEVAAASVATVTVRAPARGHTRMVAAARAADALATALLCISVHWQHAHHVAAVQAVPAATASAMLALGCISMLAISAVGALRAGQSYQDMGLLMNRTTTLLVLASKLCIKMLAPAFEPPVLDVPLLLATWFSLLGVAVVEQAWGAFTVQVALIVAIAAGTQPSVGSGASPAAGTACAVLFGLLLPCAAAYVKHWCRVCSEHVKERSGLTLVLTTPHLPSLLASIRPSMDEAHTGQLQQAQSQPQSQAQQSQHLQASQRSSVDNATQQEVSQEAEEGWSAGAEPITLTGQLLKDSIPGGGGSTHTGSPRSLKSSAHDHPTYLPSPFVTTTGWPGAPDVSTKPGAGIQASSGVQGPGAPHAQPGHMPRVLASQASVATEWGAGPSTFLFDPSVEGGMLVGEVADRTRSSHVTSTSLAPVGSHPSHSSGLRFLLHTPEHTVSEGSEGATPSAQQQPQPQAPPAPDFSFHKEDSSRSLASQMLSEPLPVMPAVVPPAVVPPAVVPPGTGDTSPRAAAGVAAAQLRARIARSSTADVLPHKPQVHGFDTLYLQQQRKQHQHLQHLAVLQSMRQNQHQQKKAAPRRQSSLVLNSMDYPRSFQAQPQSSWVLDPPGTRQEMFGARSSASTGHVGELTRAALLSAAPAAPQEQLLPHHKLLREYFSNPDKPRSKEETWHLEQLKMLEQTFSRPTSGQLPMNPAGDHSSGQHTLSGLLPTSSHQQQQQQPDATAAAAGRQDVAAAASSSAGASDHGPVSTHTAAAPIHSRAQSTAPLRVLSAPVVQLPVSTAAQSAPLLSVHPPGTCGDQMQGAGSYHGSSHGGHPTHSPPVISRTGSASAVKVQDMLSVIKEEDNPVSHDSDSELAHSAHQGLRTRAQTGVTEDGNSTTDSTSRTGCTDSAQPRSAAASVHQRPDNFTPSGLSASLAHDPDAGQAGAAFLYGPVSSGLSIGTASSQGRPGSTGGANDQGSSSGSAQRSNPLSNALAAWRQRAAEPPPPLIVVQAPGDDEDPVVGGPLASQSSEVVVMSGSTRGNMDSAPLPERQALQLLEQSEHEGGRWRPTGSAGRLQSGAPVEAAATGAANWNGAEGGGGSEPLARPRSSRHQPAPSTLQPRQPVTPDVPPLNVASTVHEQQMQMQQAQLQQQQMLQQQLQEFNLLHQHPAGRTRVPTHAAEAATAAAAQVASVAHAALHHQQVPSQPASSSVKRRSSQGQLRGSQPTHLAVAHAAHASNMQQQLHGAIAGSSSHISRAPSIPTSQRSSMERHSSSLAGTGSRHNNTGNSSMLLHLDPNQSGGHGPYTPGTPAAGGATGLHGSQEGRVDSMAAAAGLSARGSGPPLASMAPEDVMSLEAQAYDQLLQSISSPFTQVNAPQRARRISAASMQGTMLSTTQELGGAFSGSYSQTGQQMQTNMLLQMQMQGGSVHGSSMHGSRNAYPEVPRPPGQSRNGSNDHMARAEVSIGFYSVGAERPYSTQGNPPYAESDMSGVLSSVNTQSDMRHIAASSLSMRAGSSASGAVTQAAPHSVPHDPAALAAHAAALRARREQLWAEVARIAAQEAELVAAAAAQAAGGHLPHLPGGGSSSRQPAGAVPGVPPPQQHTASRREGSRREDRFRQSLDWPGQPMRQTSSGSLTPSPNGSLLQVPHARVLNQFVAAVGGAGQMTSSGHGLPPVSSTDSITGTRGEGMHWSQQLNKAMEHSTLPSSANTVWGSLGAPLPPTALSTSTGSTLNTHTSNSNLLVQAGGSNGGAGGGGSQHQSHVQAQVLSPGQVVQGASQGQMHVGPMLWRTSSSHHATQQLPTYSMSSGMGSNPHLELSTPGGGSIGGYSTAGSYSNPGVQHAAAGGSAGGAGVTGGSMGGGAYAWTPTSNSMGSSGNLPNLPRLHIPAGVIAAGGSGNLRTMSPLSPSTSGPHALPAVPEGSSLTAGLPVHRPPKRGRSTGRSSVPLVSNLGNMAATVSMGGHSQDTLSDLGSQPSPAYGSMQAGMGSGNLSMKAGGGVEALMNTGASLEAGAPGPAAPVGTITGTTGSSSMNSMADVQLGTQWETDSTGISLHQGHAGTHQSLQSSRGGSHSLRVQAAQQAAGGVALMGHRIPATGPQYNKFEMPSKEAGRSAPDLGLPGVRTSLESLNPLALNTPQAVQPMPRSAAMPAGAGAHGAQQEQAAGGRQAAPAAGTRTLFSASAQLDLFRSVAAPNEHGPQVHAAQSASAPMPHMLPATGAHAHGSMPRGQTTHGASAAHQSRDHGSTRPPPPSVIPHLTTPQLPTLPPPVQAMHAAISGAGQPHVDASAVLSTPPGSGDNGPASVGNRPSGKKKVKQLLGSLFSKR